MTKFLIERKFHVGEADMPEVSRRAKRIAIESYPEITWLHSHVVVDSAGTVKTYCIYEAPTEQIVRAHADALGLHDVEGVYKVAGDDTPDAFPLASRYSASWRLLPP